MITGRGAAAAVAAIAFSTLALAVPQAHAQTDTDRWSCRASAGYAGEATAGGQRLEPVVADGVPDGSNAGFRDVDCVDESAGASISAGGTGPGQPGKVDVQGAFARVDATPDFAETHVQTVAAEGGLSSLKVTSPSGFTLNAGVARAQVEGSCQGGGPAIQTSGEVAQVTVNGSRISTDETFEQIGLGINGAPLGGRIKVFFNEVVRDTPGGGDEVIVRRAIRASIFDSAGVEIFRAVIGEAQIAMHLDVCSVPPHLCPPGAVFDEAAGVCVIRTVIERPPGGCPEGTTPTTGDRCIQVIVLGPPQDQPTGGVITPLEDIQTVGPCRRARRFGTQVGIVGTNRGDRITGTNRSDRIFGLGGNDRVSGGRGNECIEGGPGSDQLDGSNGSDWLFGGAGNDILTGGQRGDRLDGGSGNDKLSGGTLSDRLYGRDGRDRLFGGAGNDRIWGGRGNDYIHTGNGRDRVWGGPGNDTINASTAGPPSRVDCGPGFDTVRINYNERRSIRRCERVFVISLRR